MTEQTQEQLIMDKANLAAGKAAKYGDKGELIKGVNGDLDIQFKDGQVHAILTPGRGQFNKAATNIAYKGELKYGVNVDGPINPDTGGMVRRVSLIVTEETLGQQLARSEKSKGKYWIDFVRAFSKMTYEEMRNYCAGDKDGFRYVILNQKRDGMIVEWDKQVLKHREGPNTRRYYAYCELSPEIREKVHAKFTAAYKKQQKFAQESVPSDALIASLQKVIGELKQQLALEGKDALQGTSRLAVEAYMIQKEAELAKLQAPPKAAKAAKRPTKKELGEAAKKLAAKKPLTMEQERAKAAAEETPKPFYEPDVDEDENEPEYIMDSVSGEVREA